MKRPSFFLLLLLVTAFAFCSDETGYASWYAGKFQGRITASGEVFDTNQLTAAHKTLPFGTIVRVTNVDNGKYVDVRINDRGPFVEGRIIDLSRRAAETLDMTGSGIAPVVLRVLSIPEVSVSIQVGAYSKHENAIRARDSLRASGFPASIEQAEGGIYRIVLVGIPEEDSAGILNRVRAAGYPAAFIRRR